MCASIFLHTSTEESDRKRDGIGRLEVTSPAISYLLHGSLSSPTSSRDLSESHPRTSPKMKQNLCIQWMWCRLRFLVGFFSSCSAAWTLFSFPVEMMINQKEIYMRTPMTNVVEFHSPWLCDASICKLRQPLDKKFAVDYLRRVSKRRSFWSISEATSSSWLIKWFICCANSQLFLTMKSFDKNFFYSIFFLLEFLRLQKDLTNSKQTYFFLKIP